jgi:predicted regulator of Ras-like GTPase activity (Roadblock/LC7/MglB family)
MFQAIKRLFTREKRPPAPVASPLTAPKAASQTRPLAARPLAAPPGKRAVPTPSTPQAAPQGAGAATESGLSVRLPLHAILSRMPEPIRARVKHAANSPVQVQLPLEHLLPQLAHGRVQITFGELRRAAPAGMVSGGDDQDNTAIDLPLPEILAQVPPHLLPRRKEQKRVEVPDDVTPVFGQKDADARILPRSPAKPIAPTPTSAAPAEPQPKPVPAPYRQTTPAPPEPAKVPVSQRPAPAPAAIPLKPQDRELLSVSRPPAPKPSTPTRPVTPVTGQPPEKPASPIAAPAATGSVSVPVAQLLGNLPDAIRTLVTQKAPKDASFVLPAGEVEKGLKAGRVSFPWRFLRACMQPPLVSSTTPAADDLQIELPLPVIAPLFLASHRPAAPQRKVAVAGDIPDVFGARGALSPATEPTAAQVSAPAPAPAAPPAPIPGPAKAPTKPAAPIPVPATPPPPKPAPAAITGDIGEIFGQPGRKNWTPAEIVQRTAQLSGVGGALIILQDGLLVAAQLPPDLNGDTIAAFLPQMYGRMVQYFKELKFAEPRKLTFVIDDVPLKTYRGTGVFFTVLGRAGEPLPDALLDVIAQQLGSPSK